MTHITAILPPAHIGNIPVEEWLPFVVPIVALYIYGRRRERRRRREIAHMPDRSDAPEEAVVRRIVADGETQSTRASPPSILRCSIPLAPTA